METKYFLGKTLNNEVFAVYRATFDKGILTEESMWQIPNGTEWKATKKISEWYFLGSDLIFPSTKEETEKYLKLSINSNLNKYSDEQPRDDHGRWTDGGGNSDSASSSNIAQESQERATSGKEIDVKEFISGERSYEADRNKMGEIIHQQGWDKPSLVASPDEYDKLKASGDYVEIFRGGPEGLTEGLTSGKPWIGDGNAGPGTYVTTDASRAQSFAELSNMQTGGKEVVTMLAPKSMMDKAPNITQVPKNPLPSKWSGKERAEYVGIAASGVGAYESTAESSAKGDYVIYNTSALIIRGK